MRKRRIKKVVKKVFLMFIFFCFTLFLIWFFNKDEKPKEGLLNDFQQVQSSNNNKNDEQSNNTPTMEPEKPTELLDVTFLNKVNNKDLLTEEQLKLIIDFLDVYYGSLKELKEYDLTKFFKNSNSEDALIMQTALSVLIENRKSKTNDLTLDSVKYDITIEDVEKSDNKITITLIEDSYMRFAFMSDIESKVYNIENIFTIQKVNGKYKIVNYEKVQDFYVMITDRYNNGGKEELNQIKKDYIKLINNNAKQDEIDYENFLDGKDYNPKTCDNSYDRRSALNYALKWVNKRNISEWTTFESNCQNFASQVIYNGGVIMDYTGSDSENLQWKFYDSAYNEDEVAQGYNYTWTYVPYFQEYAENNTGTGLCADVNVNIYYAEVGDVIHVGSTGPTRHAVVVIGDYKINGKTVDILVNSNTVDLENFPMSAYAYPYINLIKIYGWND